jgi:hypothetical protein
MPRGAMPRSVLRNISRFRWVAQLDHRRRVSLACARYLCVALAQPLPCAPTSPAGWAMTGRIRSARAAAALAAGTRPILRLGLIRNVKVTPLRGDDWTLGPVTER